MIYPSRLKQVARKKFGDDFSVLAVENCLLEPIALIFCSRVVTTLPDPTVEAIAAEDESSRVERKRLEKKISTLKTCLHHLHRFDRRTIPGKSPESDADFPSPSI